MTISASLVKELRERTGAGMMDCKAALAETGGDLEKAADELRKRGIAKAAKKAGRETREGRVATYIHPGDKIGVMVEINCETDFVARNDQFGTLVKDICMHIAAASPEVVEREELSAERVAKERELFAAQVREMGKPEAVVPKIVEGMIDKFYAEVCLLEQPFVKDPKVTIRDHLTAAVAKIGENIQVRRFVRYELGR
jgi:elongation factor Ts